MPIGFYVATAQVIGICKRVQQRALDHAAAALAASFEAALRIPHALGGAALGKVDRGCTGQALGCGLRIGVATLSLGVHDSQRRLGIPKLCGGCGVLAGDARAQGRIRRALQ